MVGGKAELAVDIGRFDAQRLAAMAMRGQFRGAVAGDARASEVLKVNQD